MYTKDRTLSLNIRLNSTEFAWIRDRSASLGQNMSEYIRALSQRDRIAYLERTSAERAER